MKNRVKELAGQADGLVMLIKRMSDPGKGTKEQQSAIDSIAMGSMWIGMVENYVEGDASNLYVVDGINNSPEFNKKWNAMDFGQRTEFVAKEASAVINSVSDMHRNISLQVQDGKEFTGALFALSNANVRLMEGMFWLHIDSKMNELNVETKNQ